MPSSQLSRTEFESFVWIDIQNPNKESLDKIASEFDLNYYQIKDSLEVGHLPKFEKQQNYDFIILRAFTGSLHKNATSINELSNKIAFFYNNSKIITIHRSPFEFLAPPIGQFDSCEHLLIYLINQMLETYRKPLEILDNKIITIEKTIFLDQDINISLKDLYYLKTQTRITKKILHLFQNVVHQMDVTPNLKTALQDIKEGLVSLILSFDEVQENANSLLNTFLSVNAQKNNDVMKLLTIFSVFFLPLTFIAGIYGMNFENMPELKWQWGYYISLGTMLIISIAIYSWFRRKKIL